jgi:aspartate ammonia-lyase
MTVDTNETLTVATTETIELKHVDTRLEHDLLGDAEVPDRAYWGVHTKRAVENFPITGVPVGHFPDLVRALAMVKQAAARANRKLGNLSRDKAEAIDKACDAVIGGRFDEQFVVDAIQGGAGTSTNMNANEVIANVALEIMGRAKGDYAALHPNNDVNMAQSTNDAYPTALRLAIILASISLVRALEELAYGLKNKAVEFDGVLKMGRTQLQDAVPMTLGQEFDAFHATVKEDIARIREMVGLFREVNLGATAIGTGINTDPRYAALAVEELTRISGQPMVLATNLVEATSDMGAFVLFSGLLKRIAVKLSKICNDLRLLSSGPRTGCAEGGQLQLNAFEPTIGYCVLQSMRMLTAGLDTLTQRCILGIEADGERCRRLAVNSIGIVTALNPVLGYETCSRVAKRALHEDRAVTDIVLEEGLLTPEQVERLLAPDSMTAPSRAMRGHEDSRGLRLGA